MSKRFQVEATAVAVGVGSVSFKHTAKAVFKRHPVLFPTIVAIAVASPFIDRVIPGAWAELTGLGVNLFALWLGFHAVVKEVRIETRT